MLSRIIFSVKFQRNDLYTLVFWDEKLKLATAFLLKKTMSLQVFKLVQVAPFFNFTLERTQIIIESFW